MVSIRETPLDELMANDTLPEWPVIMVLAGDPETVYDTFVEQLVSSAQAAVVQRARQVGALQLAARQPRERPVEGSLMTTASETSPCCAKACRRLSLVVS